MIDTAAAMMIAVRPLTKKNELGLGFGQAFELIEELQLTPLLVRIFLYLAALAVQLGLIQLPLGPAGKKCPGTHRNRRGECAGQARDEHEIAGSLVRRGGPGDDPEDRGQAVVDAVDRAPDPAPAAAVPCFATEDRVQRRLDVAARRQSGDTAAEEGPEGPGMLGVLAADLAEERIGGGVAGHLRMRSGHPALLDLLVGDDRIHWGKAQAQVHGPGQLDGYAIRYRRAQLGQPSSPFLGVAVLGLRQLREDALAVGVGLALRQPGVDPGRLDLLLPVAKEAPFDRLDGCQFLLHG